MGVLRSSHGPNGLFREMDKINNSVHTVTYSVIVNSQAMSCITPSRETRHGDPLSPSLFLLCAEVLRSMLSKAERTWVITWVPTSEKGPKFSHLFFADNILLFCKANSVEWQRLTKLLEEYERTSIRAEIEQKQNFHLLLP